ncbi:MAG TPA: metallophosphoesterase [Phycisphaerae bacterium]|mgnify:CR=1 FL=1|nr:metallophosphoesterase [Phycisphaerae bacterium]HRR84134.1 metallophosphoesterase [Phycisphaerae bacterium]
MLRSPESRCPLYRLSLTIAGCLLLGILVSPTTAANETPLWSIAWISDTQTPACEWVTALCEKVKADRPSMVIHTGDVRFEWANQCAWKDVLNLLRISSPPIEFHLAPGNHDLTNEVLKNHLRRAATRGIYLLDTGATAEGQGYYHSRFTTEISGPSWPIWNPEVAVHPAWQPDAPQAPYRYVFKRGGIRFIVCDCYYTDEQRDWVRDLITQPDDSSVTIILQHKHEVDQLAKYVEGLDGKHNVKLMLSGDHHNYCYEQRHGVTFITSAGMAEGANRDSDAFTLRVYKDRLKLDRYLLPKGKPVTAIEGPTTVWECEGRFSEYRRPEYPVAIVASQPAPAASEAAVPTPTLAPNLLFNGNFDNHIWYERYRGWSPSGWYQWFTCGGHAPEHAVGNDIPHSGKEYVRIHMWAHAWRGGVLQNVRGVEPCHWYRLTAYGWFAKTVENPDPKARIGLDPLGKLREQYGVNVTSHPAPAYNECVGDDPKTAGPDWPDIPESTVWSDYHDYDKWGFFEVMAEARSDVVTAILYCDPRQRTANEPIYEMNWDTVALREIPWPTRRLAPENADIPVEQSIKNMILTIQRKLGTAQLTWDTPVPCGASQVLYRFLDSEAVNHLPDGGSPKRIRVDQFPFETPVAYERSEKCHGMEIGPLTIPDEAEELQAVALSRAVINGECRTLCSPLARFKLR